MKIIGISGSPIPNSNTDQAVKAVLAATGIENEFIKLSDYSFEPCRACLKCASTNMCVLKDFASELGQKVKDADALVVGGYVAYGTLDGRTKSFLERLYCLHHQKNYLKGKAAGIVITSGVPACDPYPPLADNAASVVSGFMDAEGMNVLGTVKVTGNFSCIRCGYGDDCGLSGIKAIYGPEATVAGTKINNFEEQPDVVSDAVSLGKKIADNLK